MIRYNPTPSRYLATLLGCLLLPFAPAAAQTTTVPASAEGWENATEFVTHNGKQAIRLDDGGRAATGNNLTFVRDLTFENGTIEYDIALDEGARFSSLHFRHLDPDNTEHVYLRAAFAGDPNASGGVQYAGIVDGVNYWDLSFDYQTGVAFRGGGEWNHVKLIVRDRQALIYVNDMDRPALYIPMMDGRPGAGKIAVDGKAWIANLTVTPGATPGLTTGSGFDPAHNEARYLRNWRVTEPTDFPFGQEPTTDDLPGEEAEWKAISPTHHGLVNLSREFGATPSGARRLVWLATTLTAAEATDRLLHLGVSDEAYLYLNGQPLTVVKNAYSSPGRLAPNGRATPENAAVPLPLREGENQLLIGVTNYFFGWGLVGKLNDGAGLRY